MNQLKKKQEISGTLKHLGKQSREPIELLDLIDWSSGETEIRIEANEFTSFCPVTGQPDFGRLVIIYKPDKFLVETKSLKLFLQNYRSKEGFNEVLVSDIAYRIFEQVSPRELIVEGHYNQRGGISVHPKVVLNKQKYQKMKKEKEAKNYESN